jgi:hypothetical protein
MDMPNTNMTPEAAADTSSTTAATTTPATIVLPAPAKVYVVTSVLSISGDRAMIELDENVATEAFTNEQEAKKLQDNIC